MCSTILYVAQSILFTHSKKNNLDSIQNNNCPASYVIKNVMNSSCKVKR